ncbi:amino acid permease [Actinomycetaceae bacterium L2_0104]
MAIAKNRTESSLARGVDAITAVVLTVIIVPQIILRSLPIGAKVNEIYAALAVGGVTIAITLGAIVWQQILVPRRSSMRLVSSFIGVWTGILVSAARFLAYALIVALGGSLIVNGIHVITPVEELRRILPVILVLVLALPSLLGYNVPRRLLLAASGLGAVAIAAVLVTALITEVSGGFSDEMIHAAQLYAWDTGTGNTTESSLLEACMAAVLPSAILILISERVMVRPQDRKLRPKRLVQLTGAAAAAVVVSLYFADALAMTGRSGSVPLLAMADAFFDRPGQIVIAVAAILVGLSAVLVAYAALPRLLRELSVDRILPRYLASEDAVRPRVTIVAFIAILAATLTGSLSTTQAGAMALIFAAFVIFALVCLAMALRSSSILRESLDRGERRSARLSRIGFFLLAAFGFAILAAIALTNVWWALVALVSMALPASVLLFFRRGRGRVVKRLAPRDLTAGRTLPTRVHGVILISALDLPALRTLGFARATRLTSLTAVTLDFDPAATKRLREDWRAAALPVDLTVLGTPQGAQVENILEYVRSLRSLHPGDIVMVFIPRVLSTGVWQRFFVRHSEPRIISALRLEKGVVISEVPYQLEADEEE